MSSLADDANLVQYYGTANLSVTSSSGNRVTISQKNGDLNPAISITDDELTVLVGQSGQVTAATSNGIAYQSRDLIQRQKEEILRLFPCEYLGLKKQRLDSSLNSLTEGILSESFKKNFLKKVVTTSCASIKMSALLKNSAGPLYDDKPKLGAKEETGPLTCLGNIDDSSNVSAFAASLLTQGFENLSTKVVCQSDKIFISDGKSKKLIPIEPYSDIELLYQIYKTQPYASSNPTDDKIAKAHFERCYKNEGSGFVTNTAFAADNAQQAQERAAVAEAGERAQPVAESRRIDLSNVRVDSGAIYQIQQEANLAIRQAKLGLPVTAPPTLVKLQNFFSSAIKRAEGGDVPTGVFTADGVREGNSGISRPELANREPGAAGLAGQNIKGKPKEGSGDDNSKAGADGHDFSAGANNPLLSAKGNTFKISGAKAEGEGRGSTSVRGPASANDKVKQILQEIQKNIVSIKSGNRDYINSVNTRLGATNTRVRIGNINLGPDAALQIYEYQNGKFVIKK